MNFGELSEVLTQKEVLAKGNLETAVSGIVYSSREAQPGAVFVAVVGFHTDGHRFLGDAAQHGAQALVGSDRAQLAAFINSPQYSGQTVVLVPDERTALTHLAAAFYGFPARKIGVVGVTGTKGKTTTTFLISEVLEAGPYSTGLIGTVDFKVGPRRWSNQTRQTTPEAVEVQQLMAEMAAAKVDYCVLESSSHGLALRKLLDCAYDVAVLTNITHEHLDFHETFENYREAKGLLFEALADEPPKPFLRFPKTAIINADDPNAQYFRERAETATRAKGYELRVLTFSIENPADIRAVDIVSDNRNLEYTAVTPLGEVRLRLNLPGRFNVYNSLAALTVGLSQGLTLEEIKRGLEGVKGVSGRMEKVDEGQPFSVIVDYAHNPDSIEQVLRTLRPITPGRLITVFGSAGERDVAKRPLQGAIAARLADFAVFTNEDPRLEDENVIIDQIGAGAEAEGWREGVNFLKIADRRAAIEAAVRVARAGDTVLLAGKGHESCIIVGTEKVPWDEREEARRALQQLNSSQVK
ncbi:MAG TPA: UDP-N-acetylmuramoyl-L-alanyl-D-glutamate--2,6-diaminopimelate ligase [Chloroflexia bacterium]|nr:UDP-N-acetylmuramoyl-L-alanyl-D-glutamate--2,6-diaminopimelate ligase [Chloroflexia bacterium]